LTILRNGLSLLGKIFFKTFYLKDNFYFGLQTCGNAQKWGEKSYKKVEIVKFALFYWFFSKIMPFSSLFAYANAFSEVIVDCMARIVFYKVVSNMNS
jgi:hypothetical protein